MLAGDVAAKRFAPTKWREGYDQQQVDDFLARVQATLAEYERGRPADPLTAEDVVASRFLPTRFRVGYSQDQVDDFLDEVVVELRRHEARWSSSG
jgi:DivIVA domain-containing protein